MGEKIRINERTKIVFMIVFYCIITCSPMIQMHMASDTYNLMNLGYFGYPSAFFLRDARLISAGITYLAGVLNLSYPVYIVGMELIAVIVASISIYILYNTFSKIIDQDKLLLVISSIIIIINCMSIEYFLYAECAVMWLSILLSVLGAKCFISHTKYWYLKTLVLILLGTFCYQGSVNLFLTMVVLLLIINKKNDYAKVLKETIIAGTILIIAFFIDIIAISIMNYLMGIHSTRISEGYVINNIYNFIPIMQQAFYRTIIDSFNLLPSSTIIVLTIISLVIIYFSNNNSQKLVKYTFLVFMAVLVCFIPLLLVEKAIIEPRMSMSIGAIIGCSFIYLLSIEIKGIYIKKIITFLIGSFFIFNTVNTIQIFSAHITTNKIDANMGLFIKYKIEEYEKDTGNIVQKVKFHKAANHKPFYYGVNKELSSFSKRAFDNYFCILEALNYYCNRHYKGLCMTEDEFEKLFKDKEWDTYSDDQIVFENDTMFLCTY